MEGLAKQLGITINNFSMSETSSVVGDSKDTPKKKSGGTQQNKFTLSTNTNFSKIIELLKQMEKLSRFNSATSINIVSGDKGDVNATITGDIYYEQ
jgi:hypothetical protein